MKDQPAGVWLDRAIGYLAPRWGLRRLQARHQAHVLARNYDAASTGRRTQGWRRGAGDANASAQGGLARLREVARDLVRNNGHAKAALRAIGDHVVGWGITAKPKKRNRKVKDLWDAWADSSQCDADGRNDFYGLQQLVIRTVAESGECLIRLRRRRPDDGLPLPLQLQVLEPDYIDTSKIAALPNGGRIIHGVEFSPIGQRVAYWLFPEHPGADLFGGSPASRRIPAEGVLHVYETERPGQVRGVSWFAPVLLKFKDYDEYDDAQLMKQKIAACLAVITSDIDGSSAPLGTVSSENPLVDSLEPGMVLNAAPGRNVTVVQPPQVREYGDYSRLNLRAIATGLGLSYEDLAGDYSQVNFSSARMSRLRHWSRVESWRWQMLVPQLCEPVWRAALEAGAIMGLVPEQLPAATWSAPPLPMIEPDKEGLAYLRNVRAGIMTLSEAIRERGYDPQEMLDEWAADMKRLDKLGLVLDTDPRQMTQAGQRQADPAAAAPPPEESVDEPEPDDEPEPEKEG